MRKLITTVLFFVPVLLFSQAVPNYESYEDDPATIYYTLIDTTTNITLEEGQYVDSLREGVWIKRHTNGNMQARIKFQNGMRIGTWKFWDDKGNLVVKKKYGRGGDLLFAAEYRYY